MAGSMGRMVPLLLALALAPAVAPAEGTLRSIAEIDAFTEDPTPRKASFELTGTVVGAFLLPKTGEVVLSDGSGSAFRSTATSACRGRSRATRSRRAASPT